MTVARIRVKRGAHAKGSDLFTESLDSPAVRTSLEKSFFSTLPYRVRPFPFRRPAPRFALSSFARSALRKGRENRSRTPPKSAIQYRNLFQFHGSPFATTAPPHRRRPFTFYRSLSGPALRPLIRISSLFPVSLSAVPLLFSLSSRIRSRTFSNLSC